MTRDGRIAALALGAALALAPACHLADPAVDAGPDGAGTDTGTGKDSDTGTGTGTGQPTDAGGDGAMDAACDDGGTDTASDTLPATCEPADKLVSDVPVWGDTLFAAHDQVSAWGCSLLDENGPDVAYAYTNADDLPATVTVTLTGMQSDLDLFLLEGACAADACVAQSATEGDESASFVLVQGGTMFAVVDGHEGAGGPYTLTLHAQPVELTCNDGVDGDGDGLTDCADGDCAADVACGALCSSDGEIRCGETVDAGTAGEASAIDSYAGCAGDFGGGERIYLFAQGGAGMTVTASLAHPGSDLSLVALEDDCSSNAPSSCDGSLLSFAPAAGTYTYLVVDGPDGAAGGFSLGLACAETACGDALDDDLDSLTDCVDPDCAASPSCSDTCDPLADAGCSGAGEACYLGSPDPLAGFCHAAGEADAGAACALPWECAGGLVCTPADTCLPRCRLDGAPPKCDKGTCTGLGADPLGVCV
jgi:hypothetical protein